MALWYFKEAGHKLALLLWVVTVTVLAIIPLLFLTVIYVFMDVVLEVASYVWPWGGPINFRFIFGKGNGPEGYLYRWYKWICGNMNAIFSNSYEGKWLPPLFGSYS